MANTASSTIDPREAAHFGGMAADWWDPKGSSAMLHKLNPVRLRYIRDAIDRHWPGLDRSFRPLAGRRALADRKSVVWGKSVSVRVDLGGRRIIKKKKQKKDEKR